ncbi:reverse transcriptase [Trichonephila clavipes]|nr:reverse transcriptase [Trichonephila clavipes]
MQSLFVSLWKELFKYHHLKAVFGKKEQRASSPHRFTNILHNDPKTNFRRQWETLATVGSISRHLEGVEAVARFRLTTGHDFLGVYLHWLGVAASEVCPFGGHVRMDGDHLLQCTELVEYPADDIASRYWEARRQMVKKPSTGFG